MKSFYFWTFPVCSGTNPVRSVDPWFKNNFTFYVHFANLTDSIKSIRFESFIIIWSSFGMSNIKWFIRRNIFDFVSWFPFRALNLLFDCEMMTSLYFLSSLLSEKIFTVGRFFPMIVVFILSDAEFGPNDHREDALHFTSNKLSLYPRHASLHI